MGSLVV